MSEMSTVRKNYTSVFALDRPKLNRIMEIVDRRFKDTNISCIYRFEVRLKHGRTFRLQNADDLFRLDNTVRDPVSAFTMHVSDGTDDSNLKTYVSFGNDEYKNISLAVSSNDAKMSGQFFAELEEQVERTFLSSWVYKFFKSRMASLFLPIIFAMIASLGAVSFGLSEKSTRGYLSDWPTTELQTVNQEMQKAITANQKIDMLFAIQRKELSYALSRAEGNKWQRLLQARNLTVAIPLLVVLVCAAYAIIVCYPRAVFSWGDYESHYESLLSRRRIIWTTVVLGMIVSVLASIFTMGFSRTTVP